VLRRGISYNSDLVSSQASFEVAAVWGYVDGKGSPEQTTSLTRAAIQRARLALPGWKEDGGRRATATATEWARGNSIRLTGTGGKLDPLAGRFDWLGREIDWHSGYVLAAMTKSAFWNETEIQRSVQPSMQYAATCFPTKRIRCTK